MAQAPLDETFYYMPGHVQHYRNYFQNDQVWVYHYFFESPFFDRSSNNGVIITQAENNASVAPIVWSRQRFEDTLRSMAGTEYMIASGPPQNQLQGPDSGVWVIRKQERRKRRSADGKTELPDEVALLKTYYICAEHIYQAPSVGDIIGNKLLSATTELSRFFSTAQSLPIFTPTHGYRYLPPAKKPTTAAAPSVHSARESRHATPAPDSTPAPPSQPPTTQAASSSSKPAASSPSPADALGLLSSLHLALIHTADYMDTNPLLGEPGAFRQTLTAEQLAAQQAAEEARAKRDRERRQRPPGPGQGQGQGQQGAGRDSAVGSGAPTPEVTVGDTKALLLGRKGKEGGAVAGKSGGAGMPRVKRRKSRAPATPTGVGTPKEVGTPS